MYALDFSLGMAVEKNAKKTEESLCCIHGARESVW